MRNIGIVMIVWICFLMPFTVKASERTSGQNQEEDMARIQKNTEEKLLKEFEFNGMDDILREIFPNEKLNFRETVESFVSGKIPFSVENIGKMIADQFFYEFQNSKKSMIHILLLVMIASVFTNFSSVFQNQQVSEISFYVLYLLLITISLNAFRILAASVAANLESLTEFMKLFGPVYFLAAALASGRSTSIFFFNLVLFLIYIVEVVILNFLIPLVQVYIVVKILNDLSSEDYLSKFAELLEIIVLWSLKAMLAGVVGLNIIQGLINPAIDSLKHSVVSRGAEALPIIGDALGGMTEVVLGTAVLIKNGIGVTGALICIGICLVPIIQMAVITLLYKLIAAMIQPVSDKRIVGCISSVADGSQILLRIVFTTGVLFLLTIVVAAAAVTS